MKMHFSIVMAGENTLEEKFQESLKDNPNLHLELIRSFAQTIMLALRLKESDKISVESFRAGKIPEIPLENPENSENKVDS